MAVEHSAPQNLKGKVAIVTGASRGIGAGIALELARRGANVVVTWTSESSTKSVEELISKIESIGNGASAIGVRANLKELGAIEMILAATTKAFDEYIDILVNNAGIEMVKDLKDLTPEDFSNVFDINVRATFFMTKAVLPHLRSPGRIINITSVGARGGYASVSAYCASKAAVEGFTRALAMEIGEQGHTVNAVEPGPTDTDMIAKIPQDLVERQKGMTAVGKRLGTVEDVALVVALLAGEESRWISGQSISASGGFSMM
ncbi:dehydrogenase with different specificitie [Tothia fuscella]|uniref:Dehydrogenase with different specificitie n=1 Tax=Tothia fuscella TaxID=1048955 RepID=A0A9P4NQ75_9PEZI|nr:dehydrogenase with different specificitie [Tothia fuscella]